MDTNRMRELLDQRDAIDEEMKTLVTGTKERKPQVCGNCGLPGHSSRTCTQPKKGDKS